MAVNLGSLLVSLGLDSGEFKSGLDQAEKQMRRTERDFSKISKNLANVGRNLSIAVTAPLTALGVASFKAASDAAEMESAFEVSFGGAAKSVKQWAEDTGNAMGRSTQEMMGMAASFQDILKKQMNPGEATQLSKTLTVLTQDLASFKNLSNDVAQQKIFSGLIGEAEPLRSVGVLLSAATVEAKALEMGLAGSRKEITEGAKVQARAALIMEQLSDAQGDVIRTSSSTENQLKTASAAFEEMRVAIGQKLLPALTPFITALTSVIEGFNRLSPGTQTAIVSIAAIGAAMGPVVYVFSNLISVLGPVIAGIKGVQIASAAAGVQMGKYGAAMILARGAMVSFITTLGPMIAVLGSVSAAYYFLKQKTDDATEATAEYRKAEERANALRGRAEQAMAALAGATGEARKAALRNIDALRLETKEMVNNAKAAVAAARAKAKISTIAASLPVKAGGTVGGAMGLFNDVLGAFGAGPNARAAIDNKNLAKAEQRLETLTEIQKDLASSVNDFSPATVLPQASESPSRSKGGRGSTGRSGAEIEAMFADEQRRLEMEALSAKERLAQNIDDRVDLQHELLGLEREQRFTEINENADFSEKQKAALRAQIEALYGVAAQIDERGNIIVTGNRGLIAQQIEQDRAFEIERQNADMAQVAFDRRRELLQLDLELADTQAARSRISAEILSLEQDYRRNQLEMVLASETASDAEKKRARAILDSLAVIEAGEARASARANETDVQRYLRQMNRTPEQINEAMDRIRIDGLESLNDGLVDAISGVKSLGDVFKNVADQIISDLIRIAVQKAVIGPLANALFGGGNSVDRLFANFDASTFAIDGARAAGGPVRGGMTYLVGEKGPELFTAGRSGNIIPNHELNSMGGGKLRVEVFANNDGFGAMVRDQAGQVVAAAAPVIMDGAANRALTSLSQGLGRARTPGGSTG